MAGAMVPASTRPASAANNVQNTFFTCSFFLKVSIAASVSARRISGSEWSDIGISYLKYLELVLRVLVVRLNLITGEPGMTYIATRSPVVGPWIG